MAPNKRKAQAQLAKPSAPTMRITRSASQRTAESSAGTPGVVLSKNKKGKTAGKHAKVKAEGKVEIVREDEKEGAEEEKEEATEASAGGGATKTVVIEHCKQCNSFKKMATGLKKHLEEAVPGITVLLNPDKPQKSCFEIREEGEETFIRLLDMTRPLKRMKAFDMNKVIPDIVDKIKELTQG